MLKTSSLLNILKITMVYFTAHYLLLFVSGIWWDDWVLHDLDLFRLFDMQGSFFLAYIHEFLFLLGDNGYRILTFFIYWCSNIIYYNILQEFNFISAKGALWMSMIFACLPLNDARITQICFFYGLSLLCFLLGFLLLIKGQKMPFCQKKLLYRIISLLLFFVAFQTSSTLVLFAVCGSYLLYDEFTRNSKSVIKTFFSLVKYVDYWILPFCVWWLRNTFMHPYGQYENYNVITAYRLEYAIRSSLVIGFNLAKATLYNCIEYRALIAGGIVLIIFFLTLKKKHKGENYSIVLNKGTNCIILFIIGCFVLYLSVFPYVAVGNGQIATTGVIGRHSLLTQIALPLIIYPCMHLFINDKRVQYSILSIFLIGGTLFFNTQYMKYQRDYYINCALELRLKEDSLLKEKKNILVHDFPDTMDLTRYYTLSGVANRVYGDRSHLLLNGTRDLYLLYDEDTRRTRVLPEDYDLKNNHLEGIIDFDIILSGKDTLILKLYELFDRKKFDNYLNSRSKYTFTPLSEKEELYYKNLYYGDNQ